jgi:RNA polymerase sigma factor (sigma-70 family)
MNGSASNPADQPDQLLLDHYTQTRSAAAFAELVRRYGGMVYGTGLRVTGNREDASDVVQECFLALARQGRTIERSLPGWLHVMARSRAANRNRDEATRRYHERHAAELRSDELRDWDTVSGYVDEAIAALPDDMAELVVRCYLRGQSQAQLAAELHVSQPTISRRLDEALILLRRYLESLGVAVPTLVGFGDLLLRHASVPVPAALSAELGKMAAAGVWTTSAVAAGAGQSKLVIALVAAVALAIALTGGVFVMWAGGPGRMPPIGGTAMNPTTAPGRHVLNGVPRIGYDVRFCPFPGSVESIMSYLKEPVDYDYIMGVTGACFRRTYNRDDGGNVDLMYFAPEPQQRIFDALGYEFRTVSWRDKGAMIAAIRQSIDAGRPAIACGIIGPPDGSKPREVLKRPDWLREVQDSLR